MNLSSVNSATGYFSGLASGLDTAAMVNAMAQLRRVPVTQLQARREDERALLAQYQSLSAGLLSLSTYAGDLTLSSAYQQRQVQNSQPSLLAASASAGAAAGTYELTVTRLAQAHKLASASHASASHALGYSGEILLNGRALTVSPSDTLSGLALRVNELGAGVTATVLSVAPDDHRLVLTATQTGAAHAITLAESGSGNALPSLGLLEGEITAPQDAEFLLDGFTLTRSSNSVDDAVPGLSLQLLRADSAQSLTLAVRPDHSATVSYVQTLVQRYNQVMDTLNAGLSYNPDTGTSGAFFGESAIIFLQAELVQLVSGPVAALQARGADTSLSALGLSLDTDGRLLLDTGRLQSALDADPLQVQRLLSQTAWASAPEIEYLSSTSATRDSGPAGYAVVLTQPATRATATSALLAGGLTQTETLTFNGAPVTLQAGWTLEAARDHLSSFFTAQGLSLTASISEGRLEITHRSYGSAAQFTVTSSLDRGAGGTDLGGSLAGAAATWRGQDVAGTIHGEATSGRGQYLTADSGPAAGLALRVTATAAGPAGSVSLSKGAASRLQDHLLNLTAPQGSLSLAQQHLSDRIEDLGEEIARLNGQVDAYVAQLQLQFAAMEQTVARMQTLGSWLSLQIDGLTRNFDAR